MKNFDFPDLNPLPEEKQRALKIITETIVGFPKLTVEMVLLYGSYARGDWVEDRTTENGVVLEYVSDYDVLTLVKEHKEANRAGVRLKLDDKLREVNPTAPEVSVEIMAAERFNKHLRDGHYFFKDVKEQGIVLYDSGRFEPDQPATLTPEGLRDRSRTYFEDWYGKSLSFLNGFRFYYDQGDSRAAAFLLHQTVESLLTAFLLVLTSYRPKLHDVHKLLKLSASQYPDLIRVFPTTTPEDKARFEALKTYYIDSRYTLGFAASPADLNILSKYAENLRSVVYAKCTAHIENQCPGQLKRDWYRPPDFAAMKPPAVRLGEDILRLEKELRASRQRENQERAEKQKERAEKEASVKRENLERAEKERERSEKEASLKRENQVRAEKEASLKRENQVRAEKEASVKRENQERAEKERERAEKERLAELLKNAGIDPEKSESE